MTDALSLTLLAALCRSTRCTFLTLKGGGKHTTLHQVSVESAVESHTRPELTVPYPDADQTSW